jgi:hypothetical protein
VVGKHKTSYELGMILLQTLHELHKNPFKLLLIIHWLWVPIMKVIRANNIFATNTETVQTYQFEVGLKGSKVEVFPGTELLPHRGKVHRHLDDLRVAWSEEVIDGQSKKLVDIFLLKMMQKMVQEFVETLDQRHKTFFFVTDSEAK